MLGSQIADFAREGKSGVCVSGRLKVYEAAKIMGEKKLDSLGIEGTDKVIDLETVVSQIANTPGLSRREAKTVMRSAPLVYEKNLKNALNISKNNDLEVLPVVNENKKFISTWFKGTITKKPLIVKAGTRIKLVVDKALKHPVVVVDKKRVPVGIITRRDLLKLASAYKEYEAPVFYSGVEDLSESEVIKGLISDTLQKVNKFSEVKNASVNLSERGIWVSHIKVTTAHKTFTTTSESKTPLASIKESLSNILSEIRRDEDKRERARQ